MNVLAVYKSDTVDRTVWDRRRRNCREAHLKGAAGDLPGGYELCEIEVPEGHRAYVFADDIADMYPTFIAPRERACTNGMAIELTEDECKHLRAYRRIQSKGKSEQHGAVHMRHMLGLTTDDEKDTTRSTSRSLQTTFVPCAASLVMGDLNAVDYATGAHESILVSGNALPHSKRLRHGQPAPRHHQLHALVIDDHIGIVAGTSSKDPKVIQMGAEFSAGTTACTDAGLPQHPTKRVRGEVDAIVLGAEVVNGQTIGSERLRRMFLSIISLTLVRRGLVNGAVLRRVLGSWTYCALYLRPYMCLLGTLSNSCLR